MKKLWTLLLCMTMLLSLVTVAQADVTYPLIETFEDEAIGTIPNGVTYRGESEIFGDTFYLTTATAEISADGFSGKCFKITEQGGEWYQLGTESFVATATEPVYVNFKLRIDNDADGTASLPIKIGTDNFIYIQKNGDRNVIWPNNDSLTGYPRMEYEVGKWYDFTFKFTVGRVDVEIVGENGVKTVGYRECSGTIIDFKGAGSASGAIAGTGISLDEFYVTKGGSDAKFISADNASVPVEKTPVAEETFNVDSIANIRNYFANSDISEGMGTNSYYVDYFNATMVDDCNGGKAVQISHKPGYESRKGYVDTINTPFTAEEKVFVSTKFKPTSSACHYYGFGLTTGVESNGAYDILVSDGVFKGAGSSYHLGTYSANYIPDVWYTITFEFLKDNSVDKANLYIYNDLGELVLKREGVAGTNAHRGAVNGAMMSIFKGANTPDLCIDDMRIIKTSATVDAESFIKSEIIGETIYSITPVVTVEFDKAMSAESTVEFVSNSAEIPAVVTVKNPLTLEITPSIPLDYNTEYKLDLSGVKTTDGFGLSTGSTTSLSIKTPVYSLGDMTLGDLSIDGTTLTAPITFENSAYKEVNAYLIAALYDANGTRLEWVNSKEVKGAEMGENTFTFTNLPEGADVENIRIFAWDNLVTIRPLYK